MNLKDTPLAGEHVRLGARMVEFAGFNLPVSYSSILKEHHAVRENAGIFDVSHMGEFLLEGPDAMSFVNNLVTNDCGRLPPGAILYTVMCREDGTVIDDLLVYHLAGPGAPRVMLVVNAANIEKDFSHICSLVPEGVTLENVSDSCALIAVQGPASRNVLTNCSLFAPLWSSLEELSFYRYLSFESEGEEVLVSRTGYTGELGYEILVPPPRAVDFWNAITAAGRDMGILPAGLAARDTLRFEASFCLYGHELDDSTTPLEAGLGWVVRFSKQNFAGRGALLAEQKKGPARKLMGLGLEGRNIARQGYAVLKNGSQVGDVTSGTFSPTLKKSLCMALVKNETESPSDEFAIAVRNKVVPARPVALPFYKSRARE